MASPNTKKPGGTGTVSQSKAAAHIFMSTVQFRRLMDKGVISRPSGNGYNLDTVREEYILYIRGVAAGRSPQTEGALDPIAERARKDKEMADRVALQNAVSRGEQAPIRYFQDVLEDIFLRFRGKILPLPTKLAPILEGADRMEIKTQLKRSLDDALSELETNAFSPEALQSQFRVGEHELSSEGDDD